LLLLVRSAGYGITETVHERRELLFVTAARDGITNKLDTER